MRLDDDKIKRRVLGRVRRDFPEYFSELYEDERAKLVRDREEKMGSSG